MPFLKPSPFLARAKASGLFFCKNQTSHKFGCLMAVIPSSIAQKIQTWAKLTIPKEHLEEDGIEDKSHVTIKYGFKNCSDSILRDLKDIVTRAGPIPVKLKGLSLFEGNEDGDVLKVDIESPLLHKLNKFITENFDCEEKYPKYIPHLTIAYLKPEFSKLYKDLKPNFIETSFIIDEVEFSDKEKTKSRFNLRQGNFTKTLSWLNPTLGGALVKPPKQAGIKPKKKSLEEEDLEEPQEIPNREITPIEISHYQVKPSPFLNKPKEKIQEELPELTFNKIEPIESPEENQKEVQEENQEIEDTEFPDKPTDTTDHQPQEVENVEEATQSQLQKIAATSQIETNKGGKQENVKEKDSTQPTPKEMSPFNAKQYQKIKDTLDKAVHLAPEQRQEYERNIQEVFTRMPENAVRFASENISQVTWHRNMQEMIEDWNKGVRKKERQIDSDKVKLLGFYDPAQGRLVLDGEKLSIGGIAGANKETDLNHQYAHEIGHAIDRDPKTKKIGRYSKTKEWNAIWKEEIRTRHPKGYFRLSAYAITDPSEGFAEFCRAVYASKIPETTLKYGFPKTYTYFKQNGLI